MSFVIDTTGTGARSYEFRVNPHGSRGEYDERSSKNASNWVKRQGYFKVERHF